MAAAVCCFAVSAGSASAGQSRHETFHDEGTFIHEDFCDVEGLTVSDQFVTDGKVNIVKHGRDRLDYFLTHIRENSVVTNLANGKAVRISNTVTEKDLKITDNGDGTLTILTLSTGNSVVYGSDGKAIARNPGQVRFRIVIDLNGTPEDFEDDEIISQELVKGSTGRSDDFCTAVVGAIT